MTSAATRERVSDLFLRLSDDPGLLADYCRDPEATMAGAGLSAEQIDTLLTGEPGRVRGLVDAEFAADLERRRLIVTPRMIIMTAPDEGEDEEEGPEEPEPSPPEPEPEREPPRPGHRHGSA